MPESAQVSYFQKAPHGGILPARVRTCAKLSTARSPVRLGRPLRDALRVVITSGKAACAYHSRSFRIVSSLPAGIVYLLWRSVI
jgi:hypothetical protein